MYTAYQPDEFVFRATEGGPWAFPWDEHREGPTAWTCIDDGERFWLLPAGDLQWNSSRGPIASLQAASAAIATTRMYYATCNMQIIWAHERDWLRTDSGVEFVQPPNQQLCSRVKAGPGVGESPLVASEKISHGSLQRIWGWSINCVCGE